MVIDALRWDFVAESNRMNYVNNLIRRNESCLIKMRVHAPTVTMPRLKAMTSGTVPNFIDLVLNFGASEMNVDNIIWQMKSRGKIVFYGDNTWTKLFPSTFTRQGENVDSLFVNDFHEGDKNVTERLNAELIHPDWKMLILHYLGLDHIGHVEGPFSPKVPAKLEEMDKQVTKIVTAMAKWKLRSERPSLFLLTGDHGMRDTGGHGGSSSGETFVPLLVTGTQCESSKAVYNQIDLATTFSVLMGLPIPHSAIGVIIPSLIGGLSPEQQLFAFNYNGERLLAQVRLQFQFDDFGSLEFFKQHQEAVGLHKLILLANTTTSEGHLFKRCRMLYHDSAEEMSNILSQTFLKYDLASISLGITIVVSVSGDPFGKLLELEMTTVILIYSQQAVLTIIAGLFGDVAKLVHIHLKPRDCVMTLLVGMLLKHIVCKLFTIESELFRFNIPMNLLFLGFVLVLLYLYKSIKSFLKTYIITRKLPFLGKFVFFVTFLHLVSLGASSFIEEEHQLWYYTCNAMFTILFVNHLGLYAWHDGDFILFKFPSDVERMRKKGDSKGGENLLRNMEKCHNSVFGYILLTIVHVAVRRLNSTGDKWLHLNDIGDFLVEEENKKLLTIVVIFAICLTCYCLHSLAGLLTNILTFTALLLVFFYRSSVGQVLVFNTVFSSPKMPVILFWVNILEIVLIEFLPFLFRTVCQRTINRVELGRFMGSLVTVFVLISVLLHKPQNIILVPICVLTCRWVKEKIFAIWRGTSERTIFTIITHFWIGKMFFFYQVRDENSYSKKQQN